MPNINTQGPPIASASNLKIFGMDQNGSTGWISSNTLDSYYNERMAEDFALLGTDLSVEELLTQRSYLIGIRNIFADTTGIWYDPQDLTTMCQGASGTLPVYRPGTGLVDPPVGLMLDKGRGLELGPELWTGELTASPGGVFNAATGELSCVSATGVAWNPLFTGPVLTAKTFYKIVVKFSGNLSKLRSVTCTGGSSSAVFDTGGAEGTTISAAGGEFTWIGGRFGSGADPKFCIWTNGTTTWSGLFIESISVREIKGYHAYQTTTTARPTLSGRYNLLIATETLSTQSVTTAATNYTLSFSGTGTVTLSGAATGTLSAGTHTITCVGGTLTCTVAGSVTKADLRVKRDGSSLPAYQRVDSANTYDTAGFPLFLKRDKVDDDLIVQAPAITGQTVWGSVGTVDVAAATIAAGAYKPFGTITAGEPTCTQWIAINGTLTAAEQAILERYVYSKSKLPVGA